MRTARTALLAALALALVGCFSGDPEFTEEERIPEEQREAAQAEGEGEGGGEAAGSLTFVAVDIDFDEAPSEAPAGTVEFELVNNGSIVHNVTLTDTGETIVEAQGGETQTGTAELEPGEYEFVCDIPGHESSMNGTLTVGE